MNRFENKVAIVTGGASGLGEATAQRLSREGATVFITDVQEELGRKSAGENGFVYIKHDVSDSDQWDRAIEQVKKVAGRLDILVNNAGIVGLASPFDPETTLRADWQRIFAINVEGVFLGCCAAIPLMRSSGHGGCIINISSVASLIATPDAPAYGASKAAVQHLTKSIAAYCAAHKSNIRTNSVHPGMILTPLWLRHIAELAHIREVSVDVLVDEARSKIPLGDFTTPEDVAAVVAFLASDDARHITGAEFVVDGGIGNLRTV